MSLTVELRRIRKAFDGVSVLRDVDLSVRRGEIFALVGPSGVGKTTLLRIVNLLESPDAGRVLLDGLDSSATPNGNMSLRRRMAMVLQRPVVFRRTVFENVAYGLRLRGTAREEVARRVETTLALVGLDGLRDKPAPKLSGGQAQRLAFARASVLEPDLLLLDEFTANLDPGNITVLEDAIRVVNRERRTTILIVTHNLFQAKRIAHRVGFLLGGELVEVADVPRFFEDPADPRTRAFLRGEIVF